MDLTRTSAKSDLERLEQEHREVLDELEGLRTELRSLSEPSSEEADVDAFERDKTLALIQGLQHRLESLQRAIQLARQGKHGFCEVCGDRIDPARLEILPEATLCLKCQREQERRSRLARPAAVARVARGSHSDESLTE